MERNMFLIIFAVYLLFTKCIFNNTPNDLNVVATGVEEKKYLKSLNLKPNNNMILYLFMQKELELEKYFDLQHETISISRAFCHHKNAREINLNKLNSVPSLNMFTIASIYLSM